MDVFKILHNIYMITLSKRSFPKKSRDYNENSTNYLKPLLNSNKPKGLKVAKEELRLIGLMVDRIGLMVDGR